MPTATQTLNTQTNQKLYHPDPIAKSAALPSSPAVPLLLDRPLRSSLGVLGETAVDDSREDGPRSNEDGLADDAGRGFLPVPAPLPEEEAVFE